MTMRHAPKIVYERERLYAEVWQEPVMIVAKRYGISDVMVKKICKKLAVPTPPLGYWAKLRAGKPVERPLLPSITGPTTFTGYVHEPKAPGEPAKPLAFANETARQRILKVCQHITVPRQLTHPHPLVVQDQKARTDEQGRREESRRALTVVFGKDGLDTPELPVRGVLDLHVSNEDLGRAYRLLSALFSNLEHLGAKIIVDATTGKTMVNLLGKSLRIRMTSEGTRLALSIAEHYAQRKSWRDTPHQRLEDHLGRFIIEMYECAHRLQVIQQEQTRLVRQREEEERLRQEHLRQQQDELSRFEALERTAQDWHRARVIEAFLDGLEQHLDADTRLQERETLQDYLAWAREKVEWLDPLVRRRDVVLGRHDHVSGIQQPGSAEEANKMAAGGL